VFAVRLTRLELYDDGAAVAVRQEVEAALEAVAFGEKARFEEAVGGREVQRREVLAEHLPEMPVVGPQIRDELAHRLVIEQRQAEGLLTKNGGQQGLEADFFVADHFVEEVVDQISENDRG